MCRLFFIRFEAVCVAAAFILALPIVGFAGEKLKNRSPDGQFAMSLKDAEDHEVRIQLVDTKSHKVLLKLSDSGLPFFDVCRILWSPDSKRFAFCEEDRRRNWT
jgi:hypothetical protein